MRCICMHERLIPTYLPIVQYVIRIFFSCLRRAVDTRAMKGTQVEFSIPSKICCYLRVKKIKQQMQSQSLRRGFRRNKSFARVPTFLIVANLARQCCGQNCSFQRCCHCLPLCHENLSTICQKLHVQWSISCLELIMIILISNFLTNIATCLLARNVRKALALLCTRMRLLQHLTDRDGSLANRMSERLVYTCCTLRNCQGDALRGKVTCEDVYIEKRKDTVAVGCERMQIRP